MDLEKIQVDVKKAVPEKDREKDREKDKEEKNKIY